MLNDECCWQGRRDERRDEYFKGFSDFPLWFSCASHAGLKLIKIHLKRGIMKGDWKAISAMDRQPDTTNKSPLSIRRVGSQVESTTRCLIECDRGQAQEGRGRGECKASWRCGKCGEIFYENCDNILAGFSLVCGLNKCISKKGSVPCLCACACVCGCN